MVLSKSIIKAWIESNKRDSEFDIHSGLKNGNGNGDGFGNENGCVEGFGGGFGDSGYAEGDGCGKGYVNREFANYNLKAINGMHIELLDSVPTIITRIQNETVAEGFIVNKDLTLERTYIIKSAHFLHTVKL